MKKTEIYKIGKDLGLENNQIEKIINKITGLSKSQLFLVDNIDDKFVDKIKELFSRVSTGEPFEYIIKNAEFYSLDFYVNKGVLIPRNDTEVMVDKAIDEIVKYEHITLIDVGTGTSCIPISIIKNTSKIQNCYVIDISEDALEVSKKNIKKYNLEKHIKQIHGDLLTNLLGINDYELNKDIIITANLPYIKDGDFENMSKETIKYEPGLALYGGKQTGFELYEQLIRECIQLKNLYNINNLKLFIEIGFDQYEYSKKYLEELGLKSSYFKDNCNIYRCIKIEF